MATSTLTDTVKDPGGNVVATSPGTTVNFRLMANGSPTPGFRVSDGVNVASLIVTSATTSGTISQALENNSNIVPTGTYYVAEILCPSSQGGTQEWALLSSSSVSPQNFHDALAAVIPSFTPITSVPPNVLAGNNTFSGVNQFNGNVYFKSGSPWIDVKSYGAVGDGLTDDGSKIQLAINALVPDGGVLFFPPSTSGYISGQQLDLSAKANVTLQTLAGGMHGGTSIKFTQASSTAALKASNIQSLTIDGLSLYVTSTGFTGDIVDLTGDAVTPTNFVTINNCQIGGSGASANQARSGVLARNAIAIKTDRVWFSNVQNGVFGRPGSSDFCNGLTVADSYFDNIALSPIRNVGVGTDIHGSNFEPVGPSGIPRAAFQDAGYLVNGFKFSGNSVQDGTATGSVLQIGGVGIEVSGNYLTSLASLTALSATTDGVRGLSMTGNSINGTGGVHFMDFGSAGAVFNDLLIFGNYQAGSTGDSYYRGTSRPTVGTANVLLQDQLSGGSVFNMNVLQSTASNTVGLQVISNTSTAGLTYQTVSLTSTDSAGTGFRSLRVPN